MFSNIFTAALTAPQDNNHLNSTMHDFACGARKTLVDRICLTFVFSETHHASLLSYFLIIVSAVVC